MDSRPSREATIDLRTRIVAAMPWYDDASPDYSELDAILAVEAAEREAARTRCPDCREGPIAAALGEEPQ